MADKVVEMSKVVVRTRALSQALFNLAAAGIDTVEVSVVEHAVKVEGIRGDDRTALHVWSVEAEEVEKRVGSGIRELTLEEQEWLDKGKCPVCEDHRQLYKEAKEGLAVNVSCDADHCFWIPPLPMLPEYLGQQATEEVQGVVQEAAGIVEEEAEVQELQEE